MIDHILGLATGLGARDIWVQIDRRNCVDSTHTWTAKVMQAGRYPSSTGRELAIQGMQGAPPQPTNIHEGQGATWEDAVRNLKDRLYKKLELEALSHESNATAARAILQAATPQSGEGK